MIVVVKCSQARGYLRTLAKSLMHLTSITTNLDRTNRNKTSFINRLWVSGNKDILNDMVPNIKVTCRSRMATMYSISLADIGIGTQVVNGFPCEECYTIYVCKSVNVLSTIPYEASKLKMHAYEICRDT